MILLENEIRIDRYENLHLTNFRLLDEFENGYRSVALEHISYISLMQKEEETPQGCLAALFLLFSKKQAPDYYISIKSEFYSFFVLVPPEDLQQAKDFVRNVDNAKNDKYLR